MSRSGSILLLCLLTLMLVAPSAGADGETRWSVYRHRNFDAWQLRQARLDRLEAWTELQRATARRAETDRLIAEERLDSIREAKIPKGERTHGGACIYGRAGEVLFAPKGKRC